MQTKSLSMRRALRVALLILLLCAGMKSYAERVEPRAARAVATTFLNNNGVRSNQLTDLSERAGFSNLYIFNGEPGFVILAADNCVKPILGYSLTGRFVVENMPSNLRWWLQGYNDEIQYAIDNQLRASSETIREWEDLAQGRSDAAIRTEGVGPLIETKWNQYPIYNNACPLVGGKRTVTGCVATAMAQIMKYHGDKNGLSLSHGIGLHSYIPETHPTECGVQTVNFGATIYNWSDMPNQLTSSSTNTQINAVATLMYHCGVSVNMDYDTISVDGQGGSGAYNNDVPNALYEYFGYQRASYKKKSAYALTEWKQMLKDELNEGRPIQYGGESYVPNTNNGVIDTIAHAFICDGYDNQDCFHFNWGWGDWTDPNDGYYSLTLLHPGSSDFSDDQDAVIGIQPNINFNCDAPTNLAATLSGRDVVLTWDAVEGVDSYRVYCSYGDLIDDNATGTSIMDVNMEIGTYHYYLRSNCSDGSVSTSSNIVTVEIEYQGNVIDTIGDLRYSLNEQTLTASVIGHKNNNYASGSLTIPSSVVYTNQYGQTHTYTVTSIGNWAFSQYYYLSGNLIIPNTITSIGNYAFYRARFTGSLVIPNSVTSIGEYAFSECVSFSSISIPNTITTIENNTFEGCTGITSFTIPNSVTSIEWAAFGGCTGLTSVTIPNSVISLSGFGGCTGLTSITIPNSVTSIEGGAFSDCSSLTAVYWNAVNVSSYSSSVFSGCTNLATVAFGDMVQAIPAHAFKNCSSLTTVTIGNSVTSIGGYAFQGCSSLTSLTIPNSVKDIGIYAFKDCSSLTTVYWNAVNVSSYGYSVFSECTNLATVVFGNMVQTIPANALKNRSGLTIVTIGDSVTSIGDNAFGGCDGLTMVYWNAINVSSYGSSVFSDCTNLATVVFGDMVLTIPNYAFYNCTGLTSMTIGTSVTSIGDYAFCGCSGLTGDLTIPNSVTEIGYRAFLNCNGFTGTLTIGNSVTTIGEDAFRNCRGFTGNLTIPNSVTDIGTKAFYYCDGFVGPLTIGNSVTSIGEFAFFRCSGFTGSLAIPNSVTAIGQSAFEYCSGFSGDLTIPNSITSIKRATFADCTGLTGTLTIPNSVISIELFAFDKCTFDGLNIDMTAIPNSLFSGQSEMFSGNLTIGNSVTTIGNGAFSGCSGFIGSLIIPNSITTIGNGAFSGCSGFTGPLTFPNSVTTIGDSAFQGCSGFTGPLTIPNSVTLIGWWAFCNCSGFTGSLTIPNSVTAIDVGVFSGCSGFTGPLTIHNSVTTIGSGAFRNCSGLSGTLIIPNSVTALGNDVFSGCSGLSQIVVDNDNSVYDSRGNCNAIIKTETNTLITGCKNTIIPNSVTSIGNGAFNNCINLTSIGIPNSVTSIGNEAFNNCINLTSVDIPNYVTSIGYYAFLGCSGLTSIYSYGAVPPTLGNNAFDGVSTSIPVYVPSCSEADYSGAEQWSNFTNYQATLTCVPTFTGNGTDDLWSNPDNWSAQPSNEYDIIISSNCEMDEDVEAASIIINNTGTLVVKSGHVLTISDNSSKSGNAPEGEIVNHGTAANFIIEDGGQLVYNQNGLLGTVQKDISYYTLEGNDGWHLVAYPLVENGTVSSQLNLLSNNYDLYYYDEPTHYWRNYKDEGNSFTQLEAGKGYLYANSGAITLIGTRIGNGTGTTAYSPFYTYYNYSISENLFLATELEAAGLSTSPLGSLCWYATNSTGFEQSGISIWMANVSDSELAETSHITDGMTLVYTGNMTPVVGWNEFVFNESSFSWDGTSNVLVCIQRNNGAYNTSIRWQTHDPGFASRSYNYNDDAAYDVTSETYSMTVSTNFRPNTIFKTISEVGVVEQTNTLLSFRGELENGAATINIPLSYTETAGNLKGFNLVGNPFVHNVTSYGSTNVAEGCYRMNDVRDNLIVSEISETNPLKPAEGFFVKATAEGASITFNAQTRGETKRGGFVNLELRENGKLIDRLIVKRECEPLEKLSLKGNGTRIFAMQSKQEIAIVPCEGNEQPVNFKAAKNGSYMITASLDNMAVDFLHLIDNLTGADVDLLVEPSYIFEAKTTDYDSRFKLVFSVSGDENDEDAPFAFINNGNIIIVGAEDGATLQIVDVTGRILVSRRGDAMNRVSTNGMSPGVYVLRLINGEEVKTQKIVVE